MATLLSTIQQVCRRLAQAVPNTVYGSSDRQISQMMGLLEEGLDDISGRGAWERLTCEYTWTTLALEDQGSLSGAGLGSAPVALNGFRYLLPQTFWDRTTKLPLLGAVDSQDWQAIKAVVLTGPRFQFRIRGGKFLVNPAPDAGLTWAFEYISANFILLADGTTYAKRFTADTNDILLPDQIVQMDLRWRWKKEKGLPYAEDFNTCEKMIMDALGRTGSKRVLWMDDKGGDTSAVPGIFVTPLSWPLP